MDTILKNHQVSILYSASFFAFFLFFEEPITLLQIVVLFISSLSIIIITEQLILKDWSIYSPLLFILFVPFGFYWLHPLISEGYMFRLNRNPETIVHTALYIFSFYLSVIIGFTVCSKFLKKKMLGSQCTFTFKQQNIGALVPIFALILSFALDAIRFFHLPSFSSYLNSSTEIASVGLFLYFIFQTNISNRNNIAYYLILILKVVTATDLLLLSFDEFLTFMLSVALFRLFVEKRLPYTEGIITIILFVSLYPLNTLTHFNGRDNNHFTHESLIQWKEGLSFEEWEVTLAESQYGANNDGLEGAFLDKALSRVNRFAILNSVIADMTSPELSPTDYRVKQALLRKQPDFNFANGETYSPIFTKFLPRFIYPKKPVEDLGAKWHLQFHYLSTDITNTSFNLPVIVESYLNFGNLGSIIGVPLGMFFALLTLLAYKVSAYTFLFSIHSTASLLTFESNLSMLLGQAVKEFVIIAIFGTALKILTNRFVQLRS